MDNFITLSLILAAILVGGMAACLPLFHWNMRRFVHSSLFVKCMMWIPIYAILATAAYSTPMVGLLLALAIICTASIEFYSAPKRHTSPVAQIYFIIFIGMTLCFASFFALPSHLCKYLVIAICVSSALSDVVAFFAGNYIGKHPLPASVNPGKSWEGVAGQVIGGVIGMLLVTATIGGLLGWQFGIVIGLASACGDVLNSIAKRSLGIKDWGTTIPGHGGSIDRCCSLFTAFTAMALIASIAGI